MLLVLSDDQNSLLVHSKLVSTLLRGFRSFYLGVWRWKIRYWFFHFACCFRNWRGDKESFTQFGLVTQHETSCERLLLLMSWEMEESEVTEFRKYNLRGGVFYIWIDWLSNFLSHCHLSPADILTGRGRSCHSGQIWQSVCKRPHQRYLSLE